MKAWSEDVIWQSDHYLLHVSKQTQQYGAAVLQINSNQLWQCNKSLLFVENQALFDQSNWLDQNFEGCLIYYGGQLPDVLLQWLSEYSRSNKVILFPDYDGVGLSNYARLADSIHPSTKLLFYWMPDWQNKLTKFGDSNIWSKTRVQFENAYEKLKKTRSIR